ncbi:WYL domain-containing transcriptional regulator [Zoogloea oleivorans]|uniref:WYL domain-containing transcriptional regulator n=1 Tax=Zoogloea oleivorans TaxID=1552750 RepID=A0A6C2D4G2_9RHOO|nr:WYL domain-containing protein [Zoogloea oleivorans]TYC60886.1 WYL domain-containing transcriptional regulator [Zoogloea oleivorans]
MNAESLAHLPLPQKDRLKHIELRLRFLGEVRRPDLMQRFGIQSAAASRDLALYKELAPNNIDYESRGKRYLLGAEFAPLFQTPSSQVLSWLGEQLGDATAPSSDALLPCLAPSRLSSPGLDVLACITRAIHLGQVLSIRYHSISSGESSREIAPFALLDTGLRWHVRAFDRKSQEFRDFVVTRISDPTPCPKDTPLRHERPEHDVQWTRIVELDLVPHPDQPRPDITLMDYDMLGGVLRLKLRAALAGYALRKWSVDCSPEHCLRGPEYRLWLKDHLALYGVETAILAPGYPPGKEQAT